MGTIVVRGGPHKAKLALLHFKLAPDAVGSLPLRIQGALASALRRLHTVRVTVVIAARDASRRPRGRTITQALTIRLAR